MMFRREKENKTDIVRAKMRQEIVNRILESTQRSNGGVTWEHLFEALKEYDDWLVSEEIERTKWLAPVDFELKVEE
jgi:hypothetical protein